MPGFDDTAMDEWDVSEVQVGGFSMFGLLLAFTLIATFLFAVYWLWGCSCSEGVVETKGSNCSGRNPHVVNQSVVPLYAMEIEPGTVVLQSGDGEIFRILREYDSVGRTGSGSPPLYASLTTSPQASEFHYMPSYTRAHFQTRPGPSAPSYNESVNSNGMGNNNNTNNSDFVFGTYHNRNSSTTNSNSNNSNTLGGIHTTGLYPDTTAATTTTTAVTGADDETLPMWTPIHIRSS